MSGLLTFLYVATRLSLNIQRRRCRVYWLHATLNPHLDHLNRFGKIWFIETFLTIYCEGFCGKHMFSGLSESNGGRRRSGVVDIALTAYIYFDSLQYGMQTMAYKQCVQLYLTLNVMSRCIQSILSAEYYSTWPPPFQNAKHV